MLMGGWLKLLWLVGTGFVVVLLVWTKGLLKTSSLQRREPR